MADDGRTPGLLHEYALLQSGHIYVAGIDEAGSGAWAGPVYAGAAILPLERNDLQIVMDGVRDSKLLSAKKRDEMFVVVQEVALATAVGMATVEEIDTYGIAAANKAAMRRAIEALEIEPQALLIDFIPLRPPELPQRVLKKGERISLSIAAASILAKVMRDRVMIDLGERYPEYGFGQHKGYGTKAHQEAIAVYGPCDIHRHSYTPVRGSLFDGIDGESSPGT